MSMVWPSQVGTVGSRARSCTNSTPATPMAPISRPARETPSRSTKASATPASRTPATVHTALVCLAALVAAGHGRPDAARASTTTATVPQIAAPTASTAGPPPQEAPAETRVSTTTRARPALSAPTTTESEPALGPVVIRSETRAATTTPAGISSAKATM